MPPVARVDARLARARDVLAALMPPPGECADPDPHHPACGDLAEHATVARDIAGDLLAQARGLLTGDDPDAESCAELAVELRLIDAELRRLAGQLDEPTCGYLDHAHTALAAAQRSHAAARALEHARPHHTHP